MSIGKFFASFAYGNKVTDPKALASTQINTTLVGGAFVALINILHLLGLPIPIDAGMANEIGSAVGVLWNAGCTIAANDHLGV